jgi:Outer membrane protein beta-barrel domain
MTRHAIMAVGVAASLLTATLPALAEEQPPSINVTIPRPPPADQPLIRTIPKPAFSIEGGVGLLGYLSGAGRLGPAWNVRVTGEFTPRFAAEASYLGAANARSDDTGTLTYTSLDADLRYNVLLADQAPVQPFVAAGLGYAAWIGPGGAPAGLVIPLAAGVERMLTPNVKIGARFNLRPSLFEDLGHGYERNPPGGSTWALTAGAGGAF